MQHKAEILSSDYVLCSHNKRLHCKPKYYLTQVAQDLVKTEDSFIQLFLSMQAALTSSKHMVTYKEMQHVNILYIIGRNVPFTAVGQ